MCIVRKREEVLTQAVARLSQLGKTRQEGTVIPTQRGSGPTAGRRAEVFQAARQDKPWGHELIFAAVDGKYAGKVIQVTAGQALSLQYHREKDETISVLAGEALIEYGPDNAELTQQRFGPGDTIHLPAGARHRVTAITDLTFVEASTAAPGWREDVVRLEDKYGRAGTNAP
jgi:mannose-6-phosphate isomerase